MNKLRQLAELGQSVWLDRVRRCFLSSGEMRVLLLKVNPFNQPDVESAKERARHMLAEYERVTGTTEKCGVDISPKSDGC